MTEITAASSKPVKSKRKYTRKPTPSTPIPPNPTVAALEKDVLDLVGQRLAVITQITEATAAVNGANSRLQIAQQGIKQLEYEVGYRLNLIRQITGGSQDIIQTSPRSVEDYFDRAPVSEGVSSIPAAVPQRQVHTGPRIRSESAEDVRAVEVDGVRAAI